MCCTVRLQTGISVLNGMLPTPLANASEPSCTSNISRQKSEQTQSEQTQDFHVLVLRQLPGSVASKVQATPLRSCLPCLSLPEDGHTQKIVVEERETRRIAYPGVNAPGVLSSLPRRRNYCHVRFVEPKNGFNSWSLSYPRPNRIGLAAFLSPHVPVAVGPHP
jgi:hypothetical protein